MSIRVSDIFHTLNNAGIAYVVVGGVAVNLHGHTRFTKDLDLFIGFDNDNLKQALVALQTHGFVPLLPVPILDFADPDKRKMWIEEKGMVVFQLYEVADTSRRIDIFVDEPLPFDALLADAARISLGVASDVPIASIAHLIQLKRIANRPQDLSDIEKLQLIQMLNSREAKP